MRRSLGLLLSAVAVVWVWLLFDMGSGMRALELASGSRSRSGSAPARSARRDKPNWPTYVVARATKLFSPPPAALASRAELAPDAIDGQDPPPAQDATNAVAPGELGRADRSPEFKALHERYVRETRDGAWAFDQEQRVGALFADHRLAARVVLLNCQSTVCQLVLEGDAPDLVAQLWYVPNLRRETGLGPDSPYSFRSGQLSLYFERAGLPSEGQSERAAKTAL